MFKERYRAIVADVEAEFERNRTLHGDRIHCGPGCTECCHHLFTITPFEAVHVAHGVAALPPLIQEQVRIRAEEYVKRRLMRGERTPCPALEDGRCSIYDYRPVICRRFGMPIFNPDKPDRILACELNFTSGEEIADPQLVQIQTAIHHAWSSFKRDVQATSGSERMTIAEAIVRIPAGNKASR